jgi:hypothetical protein
MRELKHIAFLTEDFSLGIPAQQLLDRFLVGFTRDGQFQRSPTRVSLWTEKSTPTALLVSRAKDFGLIIAPDSASALQPADAVVIAGAASALCGPESWLRQAIVTVPPGTPLFACGLLASNPESAQELVRLATDRHCPLLAGTAIPFAFRLPELVFPAGARVRESLILVQGAFPAAELDGLEGLLAILQDGRKGPRGVRRLRYLEQDALWRAGDKEEWSWALLAAAVSRSDSPQGNAILDGRTEDLVRLGLVQKLARHPRGWLMEHADGGRSTLLVLDGVVADINFAASLGRDRIVSAQLFRPSPPQQGHYDRMAAALITFFNSGREPWPLERNLAETKILSAMHSINARSGAWIPVR